MKENDRNRSDAQPEGVDGPDVVMANAWCSEPCGAGELLIRRCVICGAFDVELYEEVKAIGPCCVDRKACEQRRTSAKKGGT